MYKKKKGNKSKKKAPKRRRRGRRGLSDREILDCINESTDENSDNESLSGQEDEGNQSKDDGSETENIADEDSENDVIEEDEEEVSCMQQHAEFNSVKPGHNFLGFRPRIGRGSR